MSKFLLVDGLCIDDGLTVKRPHRRGLIESYDTIICAHLLERTKHCRLVATCQDRCTSSFQTDETRDVLVVFDDFSSSSPELWGKGNEFVTSKVPSRSSPSSKPWTDKWDSELCLTIFETTYRIKMINGNGDKEHSLSGYGLNPRAEHISDESLLQYR